MKRFVKSLYLTIALGFYIPSYLHAIVVGSDTSVSRESFVTFPAADNDNTILGFVFLDSGFALEDNTTTCSFNGLLPMRGSINLNGGTLFLLEDLTLQNTASISGLGTVYGNNQVINLAQSVMQFPDTPATFVDTSIYLNSDLSLSGTIVFLGNSRLRGQGNMLNITDGSLVIGQGGNLKIDDALLQGIGNDNIRCDDDGGTLLLQNLVWYQDSTITFTHGSIGFQQTVNFVGSATFTYDSLQSSTIHDMSTLLFSNGMIAQLSNNRTNLQPPLIFEQPSAMLNLDNCSLVVSTSGLQLQGGIAQLSNNVTIDIASTNSTFGMVFGSGNSEDDMLIILSGGSNVNFVTGAMVYNNSVPTYIQAPTSAQIIRGQDSQFFVEQDLIISNLSVVADSTLVPSIAVESGKLLFFENSGLQLPIVSATITCTQQNLQTFALNGSPNTIFLSRGTFPLALSVNNSGNVIQGSGNIANAITLQNSSANLSIGLNGVVTEPIILNGGICNLLSDLTLRDNGILVGPGNLSMNENNIFLSSAATSFTTPLTWIGNNSIVQLTQDIVISNTWTVNGIITINGNGYAINLDTTGQVLVSPGSQLELYNVQLFGLAGTNVQCADNTASLILNSVTILPTSSYTFNTGSILFLQDTTISGTQMFIYDSPYTSTIASLATLTIDMGTTLVIGRNNPTTTIQPIYFQDATATLEFDGSTLYVNPNGIDLTRGSIIFNHQVVLDINSSSTANGLRLGFNGILANDATITFEPAASVSFAQGNLVYDNSQPSGIISLTTASQILRNGPFSLNVAQNIQLSQITVNVTSPQSNVVINPGKTFRFNNTIIQTPTGMLTLNGYQTSNSSLLLGGGDSAIISDGTLELALAIQGVANTIKGEGSISGSITLSSSTSQLIAMLSGLILANMTLNGGQLTLSNNLSFGNGVLITDLGFVNLGNHNFSLGAADLDWTGTVTWQSATCGAIVLNAGITLSGSWTMTGCCTIQGNGNTLTLDTNGTIYVESGSQLNLQNVIITNIAGQNIQCADNTCLITMNNVTWQQSDDFLFTQGALFIDNTVRMRGINQMFIYQSAQTSTINSSGRLFLDTNFTFSYDPIFNDSTTLIQFLDYSAQLQLNGATFYATTTGVSFTSGEIVVSGNSALSAERVYDGFGNILFDAGVTVGDNTNQLNDTVISIFAGITLAVPQGTMNYQNISLSSYVAASQRSQLYFQAGTQPVASQFNVWQTIDVDPGFLVFDNNTTLGLAPNQTVYGSVIPLGNLNVINLP